MIDPQPKRAFYRTPAQPGLPLAAANGCASSTGFSQDKNGFTACSKNADRTRSAFFLMITCAARLARWLSRECVPHSLAHGALFLAPMNSPQPDNALS